MRPTAYAAAWGVGVVLLSVGCGPSDATPDEQGGDDEVAAGDGDNGSSDGGDDGTDDGERDDAVAALSGTVLGPDGEPAAGARVTLCHGACRFADVEADGSFAYSDVPADTYALHFTTLGTDLDYADLLVAIELSPDEDRQIADPFPMAELGQATTVDAAGEVDAGNGLWLTVDPDTVTLPYNYETFDLASAMPTAFPPELPAGDPLAVWYLDPFDATLDPGATVRIANAWDLAPGTELELWTASYADYAWIDGGTVTVSDDGSELEGGDIRVLSTLVLMDVDGR